MASKKRILKAQIRRYINGDCTFSNSGRLQEHIALQASYSGYNVGLKYDIANSLTGNEAVKLCASERIKASLRVIENSPLNFEDALQLANNRQLRQKRINH